MYAIRSYYGKSFRITPSNYERAVREIEALLAEVDAQLADGRRSILGDDEPNYRITSYNVCYTKLLRQVLLQLPICTEVRVPAPHAQIQ